MSDAMNRPTETINKLAMKNSRLSTQQIQRNPNTIFRYFKSAAEKVTGAFRRIFILRRSSSITQEVGSQVKRVSDSVHRSTGSSGKSSSASRLKSFGSYNGASGSSGPIMLGDFSLEDIRKATQNFSAANKIGEGGFGEVYKGKLMDGSLVAVKRARKDKYDKSLSLEFQNEVLTLSKIEHLNLVRLFGYLEHGEERIIVVEYIGNGTLREHLDGIRGNGLEIEERLDIAIDVAHAITYLHMYADQSIIHRDLKSPNVLITEKLRAKVADFGFARVSQDPNATHISTQVKGTAGYVDPEYLRTYQLTDKSDVYSFGVLLVEMMTGRYPVEQKRPVKEKITVRWAMQKLKEGDFIMVMDPRLRRSPASNTAVERVLKLAQKCLAPVRQSRPKMRKCAEELWVIRKDLNTAVVAAASASHHSANFPDRDTRKTRQTLFGIEDGESHEFISA